MRLVIFLLKKEDYPLYMSLPGRNLSMLLIPGMCNIRSRINVKQGISGIKRELS